MEITIKVGELNLIESGSIVLNQSNKLSFNIEDLEFEFLFQTEEDEDHKPHIKLISKDSKSIQFQMINYNNPLGTGTPNPLNVASLSTGEEIFLQYAIHGINELKIFHYSWYSKPEGKVSVDEGDRVENKDKE